jgi:hypothetical protein
LRGNENAQTLSNGPAIPLHEHVNVADSVSDILRPFGQIVIAVDAMLH